MYTLPHINLKMSCDMWFSTMWFVRPAKAQISLRICVVWSEPLLVAWIFYECQATDWISFGGSKLNRRLHRLVWVYICQNATLLEITCRGSKKNLAIIFLNSEMLSLSGSNFWSIYRGPFLGDGSVVVDLLFIVALIVGVLCLFICFVMQCFVSFLVLQSS